MIQDVTQLHKQVLYVYRKKEREHENLKQSLSYNNTGPFCKFINVEFNGKKGTVLLENPCGDASQLDTVQQKKQVCCIFGIDASKLEFT
jgi:hypothetical protein